MDGCLTGGMGDISGGGSIDECDRWSQPSWLLGAL